MILVVFSFSGVIVAASFVASTVKRCVLSASALNVFSTSDGSFPFRFTTSCSNPFDWVKRINGTGAGAGVGAAGCAETGSAVDMTAAKKTTTQNPLRTVMFRFLRQGI